MRLIYTGNCDAIDIPSLGIAGWKNGEEREVPDDIASELVGRGDFTKARPKKSEKEEG
jgi:hypothetical protein